MISKELRNAVNVSDLKKYEIARKAGLLPCTLSVILHDTVPIKSGDERVVRVGKVVGVPSERCFAPEDLGGKK